MSFAVLVPIGPSEIEASRLADLAASIAFHERSAGLLVVVDDSPTPRSFQLGLDAGSSLQLATIPSPKRPVGQRYKSGKGICGSIMTGLAWIESNTDADVILKLDSDSLVIGRFAERLRNGFASTPDAGMIGAYTRTPNGTERDWSMHRAGVERAVKGPSFWHEPLRAIASDTHVRTRRIRSIYRRAIANGYRMGEHCMGGGYALSGALLKRMKSAGLLDDPAFWAGVDLPEDVTVGLHVRAVGMTFANHVDRGDVFGVRYEGLPASPAELLERGYSVIHAVKNDPTFSEDQIRTFFRERRV